MANDNIQPEPKRKTDLERKAREKEKNEGLYLPFLDRLDTYIRLSPYSVTKFGDMTGFSKGGLWRAINEKSSFGVEKLLRILDFSPELNPDWLLFNRGEMKNDAKRRSTYPALKFPQIKVNANVQDNYQTAGTTSESKEALMQLIAQKEFELNIFKIMLEQLENAENNMEGQNPDPA